MSLVFGIKGISISFCTNNAIFRYQIFRFFLADEKCQFFRGIVSFNPFLASGNFCYLLVFTDISFANSVDPDQDRHSVGPDLDPNRLTL